MSKKVANFVILILFNIVGVISCTNPSQPPVVILPTSTSEIPTQSIISTPTIDHRTLVPADGLDLKNVNVVFWHPWTGTEENPIHKLVQEFNRVNEWGIVVEDSAIGDDNYLSDKVFLSIQEKNPPNLVALPIHSLSAINYYKNALMDLDIYINNNTLGLTKEEQLSFPVTFWQQDIYNGVRYGIPAERDARVVFYNRKWAKELGFEQSPANPDEFLNQACAAARENSFDENEENDGTGGWIYDPHPMTTLSWFKAFQGGELPKNENDSYFFATPDNEQALAFLNRIYRISCAWIGRDEEPYLYFANRQALFYSGWFSELINQEKIESDDEWEVLPFMSKEGNPVLIADGYSYGIMKSEPTQQLAAWLFVRWMLQVENQARMIENTGSLPLTNTVINLLTGFRKAHPVWESILENIPLIRPLPALQSWGVAGSMLGDAALYVTRSTVKQGDMQLILEEVDKMVREVLSE